MYTNTHTEFLRECVQGVLLTYNLVDCDNSCILNGLLNFSYGLLEKLSDEKGV